MNQNKKLKGGAEKQRLKRQAELKVLAKDPKQKKLTFYSSSSSSTLTSLNNSVNHLTSNNYCQELSNISGECVESTPIFLSDSVEPLIVPCVESTPILSDSVEPLIVPCVESTPILSDSVEPLILPCAIDYFEKPLTSNLHLFFKYHPLQPFNNVSFNPTKAYFRKEKNLTFKRQWLTYSKDKNAFFCSFCLAFGNDDTRFTTGLKAESLNNPYTRIKEHEQKSDHVNNCEAFLHYTNATDIKSRFSTGRQYEVERKRAVFHRLIDIIKLIGKRGLSYRGAKNAEAAYTLDNSALDHGNFLEIVLLLSKYDPLLKEHVDKIVSKSQKAKCHKNETKSGRPGGLVTFLSKTTADYIIEELGFLMKKEIAKQAKESEFFTIQIDSTQDINVHDQLSVIIRFVSDDVNERLIALVDCKSGTGKNLCDVVCQTLIKLNLDVKNCIGSSTDGASNMRGQYSGFSAWLNKESPEQVHVWCYAHVLNLVMIDTTQICVQSKNLFGLLNSIAVFVRESYLRMHAWEENSRFKFISVIGDTRWWAKDRCLTKVFGSFTHPEEGLYIDIIKTLLEIHLSNTFSQDVCFRAKCLVDSLLKYETILTAHIFQHIFVSTTPVSKYLQVKGMNVVQAFQMIKQTIKTLRLQSRRCNVVIEHAKKFIEWANDKLDELDIDCIVEDMFHVKRISKKKRMPGEKASDESKSDPNNCFEINVYNVVYDQIITSLEKRFGSHSQLYNDVSYLIPEYFNTDLPENAFQWMSNKLKRFDHNITAGIIQSEFRDFICKWPKIKNIAKTSENVNEDNIDEDSGDDANEEIGNNSNNRCLSIGGQEACKNCIACCYNVLKKYNLHTTAYRNLFLVYKYVLTLSCTQVRCETTFSKLKYVLNRLRNCLSQNKLEHFLIMSIEKDILMNINNEDVINNISQRSQLLSDALKL